MYVRIYKYMYDCFPTGLMHMIITMVVSHTHCISLLRKLCHLGEGQSQLMGKARKRMHTWAPDHSRNKFPCYVAYKETGIAVLTEIYSKPLKVSCCALEIRSRLRLLISMDTIFFIYLVTVIVFILSVCFYVCFITYL